METERDEGRVGPSFTENTKKKPPRTDTTSNSTKSESFQAVASSLCNPPTKIGDFEDDLDLDDIMLFTPRIDTIDLVDKQEEKVHQDDADKVKIVSS